MSAPRLSMLLGIHKDQPCFACPGEDPPRWLVKARKAGKIVVIDDQTIRIGSTLVKVGEHIRREMAKS
jgi:hypothetical protein